VALAERSTIGGDGRHQLLLGASILIVDDDLDTCDMLATALRRAGYSVCTATNGRDAIACLQVGIPELILLDIEMPIMNGAEFRQAQRQNRDWLRIPTVVMTGSRFEPQLDLAVKETLRKPFTAKNLLGVVARYCTPRSFD
jgi:CheY-like chemotaxis protein